MARIDRRSRVALDEAYSYYRRLESGKKPELMELARALSTLSSALFFMEQGEFKLTRQLWKRLQQSLFDTYLTSFPGEFSLLDSQQVALEPKQGCSPHGYVRFRPDGLRRIEDIALMEISRLYPRSLSALKKAWREGRTSVKPSDFVEVDLCQGGVCLMQPMVVGLDVLAQESTVAKEEAYHRWWDFFWQAYCTRNKQDRTVLYKHMMELEAVWGSLYY